jgi:hypothetical protein
MKKIFGLLALALFVNSCAPTAAVDSKPGKHAPGQVKKATGSQSAKPYAPGQQTKKN